MIAAQQNRRFSSAEWRKYNGTDQRESLCSRVRYRWSPSCHINHNHPLPPPSPPALSCSCVRFFVDVSFYVFKDCSHFRCSSESSRSLVTSICGWAQSAAWRISQRMTGASQTTTLPLSYRSRMTTVRPLDSICQHPTNPATFVYSDLSNTFVKDRSSQSCNSRPHSQFTGQRSVNVVSLSST